MQIYNFKFPDRQAKTYYLETEQVFPVNFAKTFKNFFFTEHLRATFSFQNWEFRSSKCSRHHYLEYPLSRTFTMLIFLFGPLNTLMNFPYKSVRYLELHYLELSLCRTIFSVPSVIFGLLPIPSGFRMNDNVHFRHLNVNNRIDKNFVWKLYIEINTEVNTVLGSPNAL